MRARRLAAVRRRRRAHPVLRAGATHVGGHAHLALSRDASIGLRVRHAKVGIMRMAGRNAPGPSYWRAQAKFPPCATRETKEPGTHGCGCRALSCPSRARTWTLLIQSQGTQVH